jgi:glutamyl-tRNA synthetase
MGYLPAALRNYLVRLGWSQGDKEFFSTQEMIEAFDLSQVHRSPARFDFAKLENMNGHYMRATPDAELMQILEATLPYLPGGSDIAGKLDAKKRAQLLAAMPGLKERARTLVELVDGMGFLFAERPIKVLDPKAEQVLMNGGDELLRQLLAYLEEMPRWDMPSLETAVRNFATEKGVKLGEIAQPLRAALTGRLTSPGIFDVLAVLGRQESLARIEEKASRPREAPQMQTVTSH